MPPPTDLRQDLDKKESAMRDFECARHLPDFQAPDLLRSAEAAEAGRTASAEVPLKLEKLFGACLGRLGEEPPQSLENHGTIRYKTGQVFFDILEAKFSLSSLACCQRSQPKKDMGRHASSRILPA